MSRRWKRSAPAAMSQESGGASAEADETPPATAPLSTGKPNEPPYERPPVPFNTSSKAAKDGSDGRCDGENYHLKSSALRPGGENAVSSPPRSPPPQPTVEPLPPELLQLLDAETIETDADVQRLIREISKDPVLNSTVKNQFSQAVLTHRFRASQKRSDERRKEQLEKRTLQVSRSKVKDPETGMLMLGCEHYPRNCKLKAKCCSMWVVCRQCHDRDQKGHQMNRFETEEVMCMRCHEVQPISRTCVRCHKDFARYFCSICKFYDNTPGKSIYHCPECGICRLGKGLGKDNFHCRRCDACVSKDYAKNHKCLKKSLDANCPICGQYLHSSTKPVVFMRCGHTMHSHCFDAYTAEHYTCPLCHKALTNMDPYYRLIDAQMDIQQMPEEHRDKLSEVLCHDCEQITITKYHFLYLRCGNQSCRSYNTRLIKTFRRGEGASDAAMTGASSAVTQGNLTDQRNLTDRNSNQGTDSEEKGDEEMGFVREDARPIVSENSEVQQIQQETIETGSSMEDT